jgi:DNA-binding SARP family transcriptional activator/tetratricopeptide (TPR) repeat protein
VEFRLLGPVEVTAAGNLLEIGTPRQRCVLAALAADAGRPVPVETLIERVWGGDAPQRTRHALYVYIARLRKVIADGDPAGSGPPELVRRSGGYLLDVDPDRVDLHRFRRLVTEARADTCPAAERAALLQDAMRLWRGVPLADLPGDWPARVRQGWRQEYLDVVTGWAEATVHVGAAGSAVASLAELVEQYPLNEALIAALIRVLHGAGRGADALDCYARARARLLDQLGTEPGPELRTLHQQLLRGELDHPSARGGTQVAEGLTSTLPADTAAFTGRTREVDDVTAQVTAAAQSGQVVAIHAIDGMPGVGKTALALHLAHRLADRFPDRQLFVDLHAHTAGQPPADPAEVLATLLSADGVDVRYLPDSLDDRAAMWRDRMAQRRALLVLDNASGSSQVRPLLPGSPNCLVLVTSRRFLGDLPGATVAVPLDVLPPDEATRMFLRLAPRAGAETAVLPELMDLCGHLPLAISLLARLYTRHAAWKLTDLIEETRTRLLTITAEHHTIAAAFDLSYHHLSPARQQVLRRLGLHPGPDIDPYAAAALTGLPLSDVIGHLDGLEGDRMVVESAHRRYRMHDLIRDYARTLAATEDRDRMISRLLDYYQHTARLADTQLARHTPPATEHPEPAPDAVPALPGPGRAQAWLHAEHANLLAGIQYATTTGQPARVIGLTSAIANHLRTTGPWAQAIELHTTAADLARARDDRRGRANALTEIGALRYLTDEYPAALTVLDEAVTSYQEIDDRPGYANAITQLGAVHGAIGDYAGANRLLKQALDGYRAVNDRRGQAYVLTYLGAVWMLTGDHSGATAILGQALELAQEIDDRLGQANALRQLGIVRRLNRDYPAATTALRKALDLFQQIDDRLGQANALRQLGTVQQLTGDHGGATTTLRQALERCEEIGDRLGQANTLIQIGVLYRDMRDYPAAAVALGRALRLFLEIGSQLGQANALNELADIQRATGDHRAAIASRQEAARLCAEIDDRLSQAEILNQLGALRLACGQPRQARRDHEQALELAGSIDSRLEQARALEGVGRCAQALGEPADSYQALRRALEIYQDIEASEAPGLAAELKLWPPPQAAGSGADSAAPHASW